MNEAEGKIGEEKSKGINRRGLKGRQRNMGRETIKNTQQTKPTFTPGNSITYHVHFNEHSTHFKKLFKFYFLKTSGYIYGKGKTKTPSSR